MAKLAFGYRDTPVSAAAWGARLIVTQDGYVDFVPDRTDLVGDFDDRNKLLDHISEHFDLAVLLNKVEALLVSGDVSTREDREVELYADDIVRVVGSPQASAGYFYVSAYLLGTASS